MVHHAPLVWAWALALPAALRIALDLRWASAWRHLRKGFGASLPDPIDPAVSLIVCAHNDLPALQQLWPAWRGQVFPEGWSVEWVLVDDGSTDGTADWIRAHASDDPDLTVVHHPKTAPGKKAALAAGIAAARHDRLVLTDADGQPGPDWAHGLAATLGPPNGSPAVAFGVSLPQGGPRLLRFDGLRIAWQSMAEAALGRAYMAVGRSLAYRRSTWQQLGGFEPHGDLLSGDDDLFVQQALQAGLHVQPVHATRPSERNATAPAQGLGDGFRRKRRHLSTAPHYGFSSRWRLVLDALLDPMVVVCTGAGWAIGLLHNGGWIPLVAAGAALLVRATTLSSFAKDQGLPASVGFSAIVWGPLRWGFLALATSSNFTSSPTWTQRAPTSRS